MLKYNGQDSKVLTVLVGIAKIAADFGTPLGWDGEEDPALDGCTHPSNQVLAILMDFGCFESPDTDDPLELEFVDGLKIDMVRICRVVRDMPEYDEVMTVGLRPDCYYY